MSGIINPGSYAYPPPSEQALLYVECTPDGEKTRVFKSILGEIARIKGGYVDTKEGTFYPEIELQRDERYFTVIPVTEDEIKVVISHE